MTPVGHLLRPYIERAFAARPDLVAANTSKPCGLLLEMALTAANADAGSRIWAYVGKSQPGEAGWIPDGFVPFGTTIRRADGQTETISIVKCGMDAAWHLPTHQQVKVIANSTANADPDPTIHGPAKIGAYDIDPKDYRPTNPPVDVVTLKTPGAVQTPATTGSIPQYPADESILDEAGKALFADFAEANRLRPDDPNTQPNPQMFRYAFRCAYSWIARERTDLSGSIAKHRSGEPGHPGWRETLGLPPQPPQ